MGGSKPNNSDVDLHSRLEWEAGQTANHELGKGEGGAETQGEDGLTCQS